MEPTNDVTAATDPLSQWEEGIRERPLTALAVAASMGFLLGGGLRSRSGVAATAFVVRTVAKEAALAFIQDAMRDGRRHRASSSESREQPAAASAGSEQPG